MREQNPNFNPSISDLYWSAEQNEKSDSSFEAAIRKLEALFRKDAQQQVKLNRSEIKVSV